ncbi:Imm10 family immunity protein [Planotetraspora sp. A-T 1434]|uniref:Imm10 family immunity protein n=1 Tax=Planotetraspora sp. A-T 1434 TaxID=2979219 RepID=UPI0021BE612F|nr:Imm10 family immunity protein [Planotetraspora sp. A-T 1434]MCT9931689.1 Imm10 family immunity protein [Planotetraspora sp. A-T 1434]
MEIGRIVKAATPDGWREVVVHRCQLGTFSTTAITYRTADGSSRHHHVEGLDGPFDQLKFAQYQQGEGTWFVCRLDYAPRGKSYNAMMSTFDVEPPFAQDIEVPASAYVEELTKYPRKPELIPPWMRAGWPEGVPLPGSASIPAFPPAVEEAGPSWPPLKEMVVRTIGRDDDPGLVVLGMAEDANGTGTVLLFMMSTEEADEQEIRLGMDTYCVVRDQATTYGGVSACNLASRRLTLHFTQEAAEALDVEPILQIELQVDDDAVELLRTSLREILLSGRDDQRPHSIHL